MAPSPSLRLRVVIWSITLLLPAAAWLFSAYSWTWLHPGVGVYFLAAACLSAAIGGMPTALAAIALNGAALNFFFYLHQRGYPRTNAELWTALLVGVSLIIGYARQKWSSAEMLAGRLSTDLARLRDELESQRTDLKRFHELSVRLSSSLELQRLLNDVLTSIATLQKTDLAMLLVLPDHSRKRLRVETFIGFTPEQIRLFGELPADFFSLEHRVLLQDIEGPGTYFPFMDAAEKVGLRAVFSTPIINTRGEPLGVVATFFRQPTAPSDRQSRLVELYARQAANALDNARLYRNSLDTLAAEQQRTAVLRSLAEAAVQINATLALDSLLQAITDQARNMIGARQAFTTLLARGAWNKSITCVSTPEGQPAMQFPRETSEIFMLACNLNTPLRLGSSSKEDRPWRSLMMKAGEATSSGWLAAPLLTRDGRNLGLIQLSGKIDGEFSSDDEAILVQLAHMASVAVDNVRLYREAQEKIEENKRTQEALERSKESIELAQQYVGIGIWEWDLQTGALAWSEQLRGLHGFSGDGFDGKYESWMESIHPEDRQQVHRAITDALAHNGEYEVQYRVVFSDRSIHWLEARGRTIVIADTAVRMLGVAMDISSRKAAEEALRQSEKMAATGHLAASIAHEINNPLAAVTNALYILRTMPGMPASSLEYVRTAEMELSRVVHITRQTLGFYREIASPVMVDIPQLLDEAVAAFEGKIETNRVNVHRWYGDVDPLPAFPAELRQIFSNLLMNALEAVGEDGRVSIRVRSCHDRENRPGLRITVADNGAGITPDNMPHIFEPFFTTKESKGTGLGLWVSQGIVQKHGGRIWVRSSQHVQHHGTCFAIFLPISAQSASAATSAHFRATDLASRSQAVASGNDLSAA
ncbi:MAG TPA: ATP-binding protein [Candidatus Acidoferrales bacterium]|nr:ATP-binding protein [Candidatus Acidoferrales bacterium]